jgi:F0F1-type ATP synthase membrane subunit a
MASLSISITKAVVMMGGPSRAHVDSRAAAPEPAARTLVNLFESIVLFVGTYGLRDHGKGTAAIRYFTLFFFILFCNLLGSCLSRRKRQCAQQALPRSFLLTQGAASGAGLSYFKPRPQECRSFFFDMIPIELIGPCRPFALCRLFANMTPGRRSLPVRPDLPLRAIAVGAGGSLRAFIGAPELFVAFSAYVFVFLSICSSARGARSIDGGSQIASSRVRKRRKAEAEEMDMGTSARESEQA